MIHKLATPMAANKPGPPTKMNADSPAAVPARPARSGPARREAAK
jgi:hypothetical protein